MIVGVVEKVRQVDVAGVRILTQSSRVEQIRACGHEGEEQSGGEGMGGVAAPSADADDAFAEAAEGEDDGEESEWVEFHGVLLLVARCDDCIIRGGVVKRQRLGVSQPSTEATYDCDPCGEGQNTLSRAHSHNKGGHPITIGWVDGV